MEEEENNEEDERASSSCPGSEKDNRAKFPFKPSSEKNGSEH
jgi:hypothetical protein